MKRFHFRIYTESNPEGKNVYQIASTKQDAEKAIITQYESINKIEFLYFK